MNELDIKRDKGNRGDLLNGGNNALERRLLIDFVRGEPTEVIEEPPKQAPHVT